MPWRCLIFRQMEIALLVIALILIVTGIVGSALPVLPGPPISFIGLMLLYFVGPAYSVSLWFTIPLGIITLAISILDYFLPSIGATYFGGTKYGSWGSNIGLVIGVFTSWLGPWGIIIGPFLGALIGELIGGKELKFALKSATGSFLGFLTGTFMKIILCLLILAVYLFYVIKNIL